MLAPRPRLGVSLRLAGALTLAAITAVPAAAQEAWTMGGGDAAHTATVAGPEPPYRVAWEVELGESPPVAGVAANGELVLVVTREGVLALDAASGDVVWERGRQPGPAGVPAIAGDLVLHAAGEGPGGQVAARDLESGDLAWQAILGSAVVGGPTVEGDAVVVGTTGGEIVALDLQRGEERWRFESTGGVTSAPAIGDGTVVAVAFEASSGQSTVYAIDLEQGADERPLWQHSAEQPGPSSGAALADGRVYVGASDLTIRAFGLAEGNELWTTETRDLFGLRQVPAAGDPVLVSDRTHLYALDPETGAERWRWLLADLAPLGDSRADTLLASAPAITHGTALLGAADGTLSAIDTASGERVWRRDLGDGAVGPVAVTAGRLYAALVGEGGSIVALEHDPEGSLAAEVSPTVLDPGAALLNFALAALGVGLLLFLLFRFAAPSAEAG